MAKLGGRRCVLILALMAAALPAYAADEKDSAGFESIFDGKTLEGWTAPDMSFWHVEDGAITGEVTKEHMPAGNIFIVWQGGKPGDFELTFKFRIVGEESNSGMQFRSEVKRSGLVYGYQADMSGDGERIGAIYDEYGPRNSLAERGESSRFDENGKKTVASLSGGDPLTGKNQVDPKQWIEYHIVAKGEHVIAQINGITTAELFDGDKKHHRLSGVLAMPVIPRVMKVQFKEIRLKRLTP